MAAFSSVNERQVSENMQLELKKHHMHQLRVTHSDWIGKYHGSE